LRLFWLTAAKQQGPIIIYSLFCQPALRSKHSPGKARLREKKGKEKECIFKIIFIFVGGQAITWDFFSGACEL